MADASTHRTDAGQISPSEPSQLSRASTSIDVADMGPGASATPDLSDEESVDLDFPEAPSQGAASKSRPVVKGEPEDHADDDDDDDDVAAELPSLPVQKRRRVTRACDECRRKKIKCDGKSPCTHCSVYSYECTYDKPSNRRRNPAPQYIEALESKLQRAEMLLRKFMPDVDLSDPNLDPAVQQEFRNRQSSRAQGTLNAAHGKAAEPSHDAKIKSMIETIGQLDIGEDDKWDFHGISSGAVFLRRMKENFRGMLGHDYRTPFLPRPPRPPGIFSIDSPRFEYPKFDSPRSNASSPFDLSSIPNLYDLPPRDKVQTLSYYALNCATCLLRIIHLPTYYEMVDTLYEKPPDTWGPSENRSLGLVYSILALGCMYDSSEDDPTSPPFSYKTAIEEGIKYYTLARMTLQDVAECRDITSLQALIFLILFLQVSSNVSGCYAYLGIALRSALRMGLHRHLPHAKITPIEDETRRRVFHVVRQMDTYISATLGFPMMLSDEDIDQPLPTEVDDEYITKDSILEPPPGTPSLLQASNAHGRLMKILAKVVRYIYPLKGVEECIMNGDRPNATYLISYARIKEIEQDLKDWQEQLPQYWRPGQDGPIEVVRVRTLLRFGFAHVQMMLYRPFLHYVSRRLTDGKPVEDRYYACAAMGISVSRNIVHIGLEIWKQAVLIGPYWFIMYTQFFAILSLVFYVVENPDKAGSAEILADASAGREILASLAQRSLAADRITKSLDMLFEQLPERLKETKVRPPPTRKRSTPSGKASNMPIAAHPAIRDKMVPQRRSEEMARPTAGPRLPHRTSFDAVRIQQSSVPGQNFAANLQDLLPLDLAPTRGSSEASSTPGLSQRGPPGFQSAQTPTNSLYKVDAMMFPSGDPFAYPAQPVMNFPGPTERRPASQSQHQESLPFYGMYDDIEGQLLGPLPGYLQNGLDLSGGQAAQLYDNSGMLILNQQQQQQQQQQHHLAQQRQQREMEQILSDPNFRGDWGNLLGDGGGGYVPM